jgi:hypothetical protein
MLRMALLEGRTSGTSVVFNWCIYRYIVLNHMCSYTHLFFICVGVDKIWKEFNEIVGFKIVLHLSETNLEGQEINPPRCHL